MLYTLVVSGVIYLLLGVRAFSSGSALLADIVQVPRLTLFANPNLNPFPTNVTYATQLIESMLYQVVVRDAVCHLDNLLTVRSLAGNLSDSSHCGAVPRDGRRAYIHFCPEDDSQHVFRTERGYAEQRQAR